MKEGAYVVMLSQVVDELLVARRELMGHLVERYASGIHHGQVIAEGLEEFNKAESIGHEQLHLEIGEEGALYDGARVLKKRKFASES